MRESTAFGHMMSGKSETSYCASIGYGRDQYKQANQFAARTSRLLTTVTRSSWKRRVVRNAGSKTR